jgi:hypothetical protein
VQQWTLSSSQQLQSAAPAALCVYSDGCGGGDLVLFECHGGPPVSFSAQQGYLAMNDDVAPPAQVNVSAAKAMCAAMQFCVAITFADSDPTCGEIEGKTCQIFFKRNALFSGDPQWTTLIANWSAAPGGASTTSAPGAADAPVGSCCAAAPGVLAYCNTQFVFSAADGTLRVGGGGAVDTCVTARAQPGLALFAAPCEAGNAAQLFFTNTTDGSVRAGTPAAPSGLCVSADASPTSTWLKPLASGAFAIAAVNAGDLFSATAVCDFATCLGGATGWTSDQKLVVRDLWAKSDIANTTAGAGWTSPVLAPAGGHALHTLTPVF